MTTTGWIIALSTLIVGICIGVGVSAWWFERTHSLTAYPPPEDTQNRLLESLAVLEPLRQNLAALDERVHQLDRRHGAQLATVSEQLRHSYAVDRLVLEATQGLDSILRHGPKRGTWGEASLRRVVEAAGLNEHVDFVTQLRLDDGGRRPDLVVNLPAGAHLVVDAKVPLDAYLRDHGEDGENDSMRAHCAAVRSHVRQLSRRDYTAALPGAVESVIMYLPSEAVVAATFNADPQLFEAALDEGVIVVGPAGLVTLLQSVASLWARQHVEDDAKEIVALGRTLVDRLNVLTSHLTRLGSSLGAAVEHFNAAVGSYEQRLLVTARQVTQLRGRLKDGPEPIQQAVRELPRNYE